MQIMIHFDIPHISAVVQVAVYDLGRLNTQPHIILIIQQYRLGQNLIQNFLSNLFEWYWQITKHSKAAVITSLRKTEFKCTLALKMDTQKQRRL